MRVKFGLAQIMGVENVKGPALIKDGLIGPNGAEL